MAQVMKMRWEGITPDQYEALRSTVQLESDSPEGLIFHVAWFRDGGMTAIDTWESSAQFDDFFKSRLAPGIQQHGLEGEPQIKWIDAYAFHNPAVPVGAAV